MRKVFVSPIIFLLLAIIIFFKPYIFQQQLPIPADTIIGLYHPFRDLYVKDYPNGIPYKNFLITDPVRQQYPWRFLSIDSIKHKILPLWNPYTAAGTPLLANFQTGAFYPLNVFLFLFPFAYGWSFLILLQPILAGIFLYFYLNNLRLKRYASFLGALTFSFSGFLTAWLEWGTIGHTVLWLPIILLSIDKIFINPARRLWSFVFVFALTAAFLAGHLQTFFYVSLICFFYFLARWLQYKKSIRVLIVFLVLTLCFFIITSAQWYATFQYISLSARSIDQIDWHKAGWFIPWEHLIQFIAPDFFGNPATLNYWGTWNYGEFIGYIGILPLIMALFSMYCRRDKKTLFFGALFFLSLVFSLPTLFATLPYLLNIPFLSTTQPTRLLLVTDFALSVLAGLGFDFFLRTNKKIKIFYSIGFLGLILVSIWFIIIFGIKITPSFNTDQIVVAKRNLYIPSFFFITSALLLGIWVLAISQNRFAKLLNRKIVSILLLVFLLGLSGFDLIRFSQKFTPFTNSSYLFPSTKSLDFIQKQKGNFRVITTDSRILPPNFAVMYRIQSLDSYDPLYLLRYGELMTAINRDKPDIRPPFGFNRIITPHNVDSRLIDLLGVQYILSLSDINSSKLEKVYVEGQTQIYKNKEAFPRTFFVENIITAFSKEQSIKYLFDRRIDLKKAAVVENDNALKRSFSKGTAEVVSYAENNILIHTSNTNEGFLVLMDSFYPTWKVKVCNEQNNECKEAVIFRTNYNFRGVIVPAGTHHIVFYNSLL